MVGGRRRPRISSGSCAWVDRPLIGNVPRRPIAIRLDAVLEQCRKAARRPGVECQTLINAVLATHVRWDVA